MLTPRVGSECLPGLLEVRTVVSFSKTQVTTAGAHRYEEQSDIVTAPAAAWAATSFRRRLQ